MAELPPPPERIVLTHFIVSDDVERSRRFYTEVLGGTVAFSGPGGLTYVALSNSWIIINVGGGPTDDRPTVTRETPRDLHRVSSFLNIRVKDIAAVYAEWSARGAEFLNAAQTAPVRDPLLHPRSRRTHHRSRTNHGPRRGLDARSLVVRAYDLRDGSGHEHRDHRHWRTRTGRRPPARLRRRARGRDASLEVGEMQVRAAARAQSRFQVGTGVWGRVPTGSIVRLLAFVIRLSGSSL
jgi:catechol 2,3-dioxygenase-like lactoylglutathione lyase family enzyme